METHLSHFKLIAVQTREFYLRGDEIKMLLKMSTRERNPVLIRLLLHLKIKMRCVYSLHELGSLFWCSLN